MTDKNVFELGLSGSVEPDINTESISQALGCLPGGKLKISVLSVSPGEGKLHEFFTLHSTFCGHRPTGS